MAFAAAVARASEAAADDKAPTDPCTKARVRIEGQPDERWSLAIASACRRLTTATDRDPTAAVHLIPSESDLLVEVTLADGRSTIRRLRETAALEPTLDALVLLPPESNELRAKGSAAARPVAAPESETLESPETAPRSAPLRTAVDFGVELGAGVVGRTAGAQGYLSVGPEFQAFVRAERWLFGLTARWDVNQWKEGAASGFEMETVGVGVGVGRRFGIGGLDLDLGLSPRLVSETQTFESDGAENTASATDVRFGGFARLGLGRSKLRFALTLDGELSPSRIRRSIALDPALPSLPSWSAGLGIAVTWREP
ncbi:hypothetical protein AKJ09_01541 [Labilithrix luteola]|uniref:Outer membrane protein beta-barrel domain-containing protein n=1 Tax=Labilithrix luteola TaxID=1391654 RepID=A0A0K1PMY5_9BACT|nr:hypothetical protein [Labilithrix luteola]AKU94877.1 hypothetical protein AKJ09_01541 [Labilithrix luteola]